MNCDTTLLENDGTVSKIVDCQGRGICVHTRGEDYPMCDCDTQYEGYNCGIERDLRLDGPGI